MIRIIIYLTDSNSRERSRSDWTSKKVSKPLYNIIITMPLSFSRFIFLVSSIEDTLCVWFEWRSHHSSKLTPGRSKESLFIPVYWKGTRMIYYLRALFLISSTTFDILVSSRNEIIAKRGCVLSKTRSSEAGKSRGGAWYENICALLLSWWKGLAISHHLFLLFFSLLFYQWFRVVLIGAGLKIYR